ncbi:MAG: ribonuclease H family protein [Anaerovoracaceae bacterium]
MGILRIYTDGACSGNQHHENIGGWGAILEFAGRKKELFGGEENTTNNRMEMMALLKSFQVIKKDKQNIQVFCDSSYLMDCFRKEWYKNWQVNGWKNKARQDVANKDLWQQLIPYLDKHQIEFFRVKGHVNLNSKVMDFDKLYKKFIEWNGDSFSYDDFLYVTEMNNRADGLANEGMDEYR